jgi:hypothetical protein
VIINITYENINIGQITFGNIIQLKCRYIYIYRVIINFTCEKFEYMINYIKLYN